MRDLDGNDPDVEQYVYDEDGTPVGYLDEVTRPGVLRKIGEGAPIEDVSQ